MTTGSSSCTVESSPVKKKGWPKGRKRRQIPRDANAPRPPLSGYMLYMGDQRELLKQNNDTTPFAEVTKLVAQKWVQLDSATKQKYLEASEADKARYQRELEEYRKSEAYQKFLEKQKLKELKKQQKGGMDDSKAQKAEEKTAKELQGAQGEDSRGTTVDIPIFTEEFLAHNKAREIELRQLRKSTTEYEEQNAILQKHVEGMRVAVTKLDADAEQLTSTNVALKQHLENLKSNLTAAFASVPIPGTNELPTEEAVQSYMSTLHKVLSSNPQQHHKLSQNVKNIVTHLPHN